MMDFLFLNKDKILIALASLPIIKFLVLITEKDPKEAFAILLLQLWLTRGIYKFICGEAFSIAPGEISTDAGPWIRISVAAFAFSFYFILFLF